MPGCNSVSHDFFNYRLTYLVCKYSKSFHVCLSSSLPKCIFGRCSIGQPYRFRRVDASSSRRSCSTCGVRVLYAFDRSRREIANEYRSESIFEV
jgi:hypothetical protein